MGQRSGGAMIATILFNIQVSGEPRNIGDGNNEYYVAQAFAPNGEVMQYRGDGPTVFAALDALAQNVKHRKGAAR
jgi:hypothetical protein